MRRNGGSRIHGLRKGRQGQARPGGEAKKRFVHWGKMELTNFTGSTLRSAHALQCRVAREIRTVFGILSQKMAPRNGAEGDVKTGGSSNARSALVGDCDTASVWRLFTRTEHNAVYAIGGCPSGVLA